MSSTRYDPMESWGKVRVDALELQDPYVPLPLTTLLFLGVNLMSSTDTTAQTLSLSPKRGKSPK